jgi:hypothetical protein
VPVRRLVSALTVALITTATLVGCSPPIDGKPVVGPTDLDQAYFFAGDVPVYGQRPGADDITVLAYLRALRRVAKSRRNCVSGNTFRIRRVRCRGEGQW